MQNVGRECLREPERRRSLSRRLERLYFRARGYYPTELGGRQYRFQPDDRKFWRKVVAQQWEPHTFKILDAFLDKSSVYIDIGAWVGPTVIYAAARCQQVYCFEPDPVAYEHLLCNLRLNSIRNVTTFHGAVHTKNGTVAIQNDTEMGNSMTRVATGSNEGIQTFCLTFEHALELIGNQKIDLLKLDVEGAEFELLPHMSSYLENTRPSLYLSTHTPLVAARERGDKLQVVAQLADLYSRCLDRDLRPLQRSDLLGPRFTDKFSEVIFTERNDL